MPDNAKPVQLIPDQSNWREWLVQSLHETGAQKTERDYFSGVVLPIIGLCLIAAFGLFVSVSFQQWQPTTEGDRMAYPVLFLIWVAISIFLLGRTYNMFLRRSWQTLARNAEEELQEPSSRRPILYLRSFKLDDEIGRPAWYERIGLTIPRRNREQRMAVEFRRYGPVIAIGRPGEKLPPLGAARFYVSNELWQEKVSDVVKVSQMVLWVTGVTEGLHWEIVHLINSLPPERLILCAHPHLLDLSPEQREKEWQHFVTTLGKEFPHPLPQRLGYAQFIHFGPAFEPYEAESLREVLEAKHFPTPSLARTLRAFGKSLVSLHWLSFLFSFKGRVNRGKFWLFFVLYQMNVLFWIFLAVQETSVSNPQTLYNFMTADSLLAVFPAIAVGVKRLHDRGSSGWWLLILYAAPALLWLFGFQMTLPFAGLGILLNPAALIGMNKYDQALNLCFWAFILNLAALIVLGGLRGNIGPNRYGSEPEIIDPYQR